MSGAFAKEFEPQSLQTLYTKMRKTAKARFNCAKRLRAHETLSLWILPLFSAGLIGMTLLSALQIHTNLTPPLFNLLEIMLALLVLVISLILSANKYSDRAEKMHRCALEINALCHQILPECVANPSNVTTYNTTADKYAAILDAYENHSDIDFALVKLELTDDYPLEWHQRAAIRLLYIFNFWLHIVLLCLLPLAAAWLFWPVRASA
ncbi:MAG: SLATT domain-containing protein [Chthoniobacterales bacterium]